MLSLLSDVAHLHSDWRRRLWPSLRKRQLFHWLLDCLHHQNGRIVPFKSLVLRRCLQVAARQVLVQLLLVRVREGIVLGSQVVLKLRDGGIQA